MKNNLIIRIFCAIILFSSITGIMYGQERYNVLLNMVHHNPGEPLFTTRFTDPNYLKSLGYNGQVPKMEVQCGLTYDHWKDEVIPIRSKEREWIERHSASVRMLMKHIKDAGIECYPFTDVLVLPQTIMEKYGNEMKNEKGQLSILKPMTQEIVRAQIEELFWRYPDMDGITVRFGETYLHDVPFHKGGSPVRTPEEHALLINILREEVCVKRNKKLFYRTWDFGQLHTRPELYMATMSKVEPHPNLYIMIKHVNADFLRNYPFNKTIGLGKLQQIVEISINQAGCYGKNSHPYYIGKGVIDGWNDMSKDEKKGIRELYNVPIVKGFWLWTWGDGWEGPYFDNEFWTNLNESIIRAFVKNPLKSEEELFNEYATNNLKLSKDDSKKLRKLSLLSEDAVYFGQETKLDGRYDWWIRDQNLSGVNLTNLVKSGQQEKALKEKKDNLNRWYEMEKLSREINLSNPRDKEFMEVSTTYGRIKYELAYQIWRAEILLAENKSGKDIDKKVGADIVNSYENKWQEWVELKKKYPCCPTLYSDWRSLHVRPPFQKDLELLKSKIK